MDSSRLTSISLVDGLRNNEASYWERLVTLYGPIVQFWIKRAGVPESQSDDLQQEVLLAVSRNIEGYQHSADVSGSLRRWMWGIARNKINDYRRKEYNRTSAKGGSQALSELMDLPDRPFEDSDPELGNQIQMGLISRALNILERDFEPKTWQAFVKTVVEEQKSKDVADALGMTSQAVRQARFRVLKRLRDELGNELPDD